MSFYSREIKATFNHRSCYDYYMEVYLVGGAVRDKLLGLPVKERDWVVVGATPEQMLQKGYTPVGKDFPVFLHPETKEEYALARTERKTGNGYTGFQFHAAPNVTLKEDLRRRDLTINAMAENIDGEIIDPYGGAHDLQHGLLRHVSNAFVEDPVRVLRIARFNARFAAEGFHVAPETEHLLKQITQSGELEHLIPERVWAETRKALNEQYPSSYFYVLHECGALPIIFPELATIFTDDIMATLQHATLLSNEINVRFASLCQFITSEATEQLCARLRTDNACAALAYAVSQCHHIYAYTKKNSPQQMLNLFNSLDVWRKPELFDNFLLACQANILLKNSKEINRFWCHALLLAQEVAIDELAKDYQGKALGEAIQAVRLKSLQKFLIT